MKRGREREESKEGSVRIEVFVIPGIGLLMLGRGYIIHRLKIQYFFKNLLLYNQAYIRQTKSIAGVLMLGRCHISHYSEYVVSSTLSMYSTLIAIVFIMILLS